MSKNKFMVGALFGAAVGAVAGLLTAPKSGKETRAELLAKGDKVKADLGKKADEFSTAASKSVSDVKGKVNSTADDVRKNAVELKKRTDRAIEGAKQGFNETDIKNSKKK